MMWTQIWASDYAQMSKNIMVHISVTIAEDEEYRIRANALGGSKNNLDGRQAMRSRRVEDSCMR